LSGDRATQFREGRRNSTAESHVAKASEGGASRSLDDSSAFGELELEVKKKGVNHWVGKQVGGRLPSQRETVVGMTVKKNLGAKGRGRELVKQNCGR